MEAMRKLKTNLEIRGGKGHDVVRDMLRVGSSERM